MRSPNSGTIELTLLHTGHFTIKSTGTCSIRAVTTLPDSSIYISLLNTHIIRIHDQEMDLRDHKEITVHGWKIHVSRAENQEVVQLEKGIGGLKTFFTEKKKEDKGEGRPTLAREQVRESLRKGRLEKEEKEDKLMRAAMKRLEKKDDKEWHILKGFLFASVLWILLSALFLWRCSQDRYCIAWVLGKAEEIVKKEMPMKKTTVQSIWDRSIEINR
ncbi:MAG: hypothetical protein M1820_007846 [Bogoriella megaspora]|nr:MAG: hypothetical protein M1820_007846 [Bogoriella megaspora]